MFFITLNNVEIQQLTNSISGDFNVDYVVSSRDNDSDEEATLPEEH